jgi:hypothetical protein
MVEDNRRTDSIKFPSALALAVVNQSKPEKFAVQWERG